MIPHHLFNETVNFQVQNTQVYCIPRYSAFRILQQQKANTILSLPFWKGVLSPKGLKSWGRIGQLSGRCPWDYTHALAYPHHTANTSTCHTKDAWLPPSFTLPTGAGKEPFCKTGCGQSRKQIWKYFSSSWPRNPGGKARLAGWWET